MSSNVRAVVAAHGTFAAGLVSAVNVITGRGDELRALSNEGLSTDGVVAAIGAALDESGSEVVFTDLPAGSCTLAARKLQKTRPALSVVTGANLPMLLEFVLRDANAQTDVAAVAERGREHMRVFAGANVR